jgi:hypothetical protein
MQSCLLIVRTQNWSNLKFDRHIDGVLGLVPKPFLLEGLTGREPRKPDEESLNDL